MLSLLPSPNLELTINLRGPVSARFPGRKLSLVRTGILAGVVAAVTAGGFVAWGDFQDQRAAGDIDSIFSGYVDVTATPRYAFEDPVSKEAQNVVLSFIVASTADACTPSWGTFYSLDEAAATLDLDRRVARLQQLGGSATVSFGGLTNTELAVGCTDTKALKDAYAQSLDRYEASTMDLDIEGAALSDTASLDRRSEAVAALQKERAAAGKPLAVWLTLPVDPNGLTAVGRDAVARMIASGTDLAGVNAMTMDYGGSRLMDKSMYENAVSAAEATHQQLTQLYKDAGVDLGSDTVWRKIGLTPMIGQNDVQGEIFTLQDAQDLSTYASTKGAGRLSIWSLNRDRTCSENFPDVTKVSDSCSGVDQGSSSFAEILGAGVKAPTEAPDVQATTAAPAITDDPATSPYPIWFEDAAYTTGQRVVWHSNVYEAKYWTRGDIPDNAVLQGDAAPWRIIGPVLAGDRPTPQLTAPAGTAPEWDPTTIYRKGDRILFEGRVFEAKWWTQTDSPEAALQGSPDSPWNKLTDAELAKLINGDASPSPASTASAEPTS